jgi:hypothetical protein
MEMRVTPPSNSASRRRRAPFPGLQRLHDLAELALLQQGRRAAADVDAGDARRFRQEIVNALNLLAQQVRVALVQLGRAAHVNREVAEVAFRLAEGHMHVEQHLPFRPRLREIHLRPEMVLEILAPRRILQREIEGMALRQRDTGFYVFHGQAASLLYSI